MLRRALLIEAIVKSGSVESFQLFVRCEADRIRMVLQEGGEKFLLPDPPSNRILLREPRMLRGAQTCSQASRLFVDPHGSVATTTETLDALYKVMRNKSWEL